MATVGTAKIRVDADHDDGTRDEGDRVTVHANDLVIDIIANEDGSVYVEAYAFDGRTQQAVVQHASIDRYKYRHPNLRLEAVNSPR